MEAKIDYDTSIIDDYTLIDLITLLFLIMPQYGVSSREYPEIFNKCIIIMMNGIVPMFDLI